MKRILITGMSGTGKSTVVGRLQARGFEAVDTDEAQWSEFAAAPGDIEPGWVWREERMRKFLAVPRSQSVFVSGCVSNQGKFYPEFDHVVLFSAPTEIILKRLESRTNNAYGKVPAEREEILGYLETVEPLLRRGADLEINTAEFSAEQITEKLIALTRQS
ncbi:AAA family ATPase [Deinococcus alpinitundrae]|uniref:AAA family ATPase n=1 Tax=Deinococcus alpinitundrae TaxID=468913 RepID=UPI00192A22E9|nr:AAA family ATPase [Deinococcus alpinitundrae]